MIDRWWCSWCWRMGRGLGDSRRKAAGFAIRCAHTRRSVRALFRAAAAATGGDE